MEPYYQDEHTALYYGDMREVLPALDITADVVITDPPYQETGIAWDRWPDRWPSAVADVTDQMWCFGSIRMFFTRLGEFANWKLAQDVVWEKQLGAGLIADRFRRVHEHVLHWYRGPWGETYKEPQRESEQSTGGRMRRRHGDRFAYPTGAGAAVTVSDGTRLVRSVVYVPNRHENAINETQKPVRLVSYFVAYSCPPGGLVVDPFSGSGAVLVAARLSGRRAVGVELRESQCEAAARRLQQGVLLDAEPASAVPSPSFPETPLFDVS